MNTLSDTEKREIVSRPNGSDTVVQLNRITSIEALTFAVGFLAHHFLYHQSKEDGVQKDTAKDVMNGLWAAGNRFDTEVVDALDEADTYKGQISELGQGEVKNPYIFLLK